MLQEVFDALDRQVRVARRRRRAWRLGARSVRTGARVADLAEKVALRRLAWMVMAMVCVAGAMNLLDHLA